MKSKIQPWQFLLLVFAGWINRTQQDAIEYLRTGNRILREKLGKKRILLNDVQRRRLAATGKIFFGEKAVQAAVAGILSWDSQDQLERTDQLIRFSHKIS